VVTKPPRALVAEDERVLREELCEHLRALWPELEIVATTSNGQAAMRAIDGHAPDVLFLDIQMPGATGLEVARHASGRCHVVFVTAFDEFAVAAFEQGAADYVMKPFAPPRIARAIERLKLRLAAAPADLTALVDQLLRGRAPPKPYLRWINAARGEEVRLVTVDEVRYFKSDIKYTRVVTADSEWLIRKSVRELCDELDPQMFRQIHRSIIVNMAEVSSVSRDFRGRPVIHLRGNPVHLSVSAPFVHLFRQM
jgi:DNA-binding LytR/AlgR family response regulator